MNGEVVFIFGLCLGMLGTWFRITRNNTPYSMPENNNDDYPLMEPWENYLAPIENIFDTVSPATPYPSIMGNHTP